MPDAPISPDKLLEIVIQVAVLLFAVSVHESAHGWMALRCGDTTARDLGRITLNPVKHLDPFGSLLVPALLAFSGAPIFGWAKPVPVSLRGVRNPRRANLLVSAAGPVSNFAVALLGGVASSSSSGRSPRRVPSSARPSSIRSSSWRSSPSP